MTDRAVQIDRGTEAPPPRPLKICILLSTFSYDGIKRSVVHFANEMHDLGHEVWVGVLHEWPGKLSLRSELRIPPERIVCWDGLGQGRRELAILRFFRQQRFDVVHANTIKMNHLGRWLAWLAGVPCIFASEDNLCLRRSWRTRMEDRLLARLGHGMVMISQKVADSFLEEERLPREKVHVIYYGLPVEALRKGMKSPAELAAKRKELGLGEGPVVACAARFDPSKSLETYLQAARLVIDRMPNVQFLLADDGGERKKLEALCSQLGIGRRFHFIGARSDIYEIFQLSDLVLLSSLWEGLGFSLMEAMTFEKPVVGTDVSGINEIIQHNRNGLLVPKQSPEKLSEAILTILSSPDLARRMGKEGLAVIRERFDVQKNAHQLLDLYRQALKRG